MEISRYITVAPHKLFDVQILEQSDVQLILTQWVTDDIENLKNGIYSVGNSKLTLGLTKPEMFFLYQAMSEWFAEYLDRNNQFSEIAFEKKELPSTLDKPEKV